MVEDPKKSDEKATDSDNTSTNSDPLSSWDNPNVKNVYIGEGREWEGTVDSEKRPGKADKKRR